MAMIEFQDRDGDSKDAILDYLKTGKPAVTKWSSLEVLAVVLRAVAYFVAQLPTVLRCLRYFAR